jgi:HPr kinase/phosphorylase
MARPSAARAVHATAVAIGNAGVLLRGPPGAGKSDLALRLIADGARLIADDRVTLARVAGRVELRAPDRLRGRIEARGIGIVAVPFRARAPLALVVDLVEPRAIERLPGPARRTLLGVSVPRVAVAPFEASAPAKVRLAVAACKRDSTARP